MVLVAGLVSRGRRVQLDPGQVGCGTGQLTQRLAGRGFDLTAIDIGPSMIAAARRRLGASALSFQAVSFEDFAAPEASFDLITSGTAFHWVDPEITCSQPALLRPGGWLALLAAEDTTTILSARRYAACGPLAGTAAPG